MFFLICCSGKPTEKQRRRKTNDCIPGKLTDDELERKILLQDIGMVKFLDNFVLFQLEAARKITTEEASKMAVTKNKQTQQERKKKEEQHSVS